MGLPLLFKGFNYTSSYAGNYAAGDTYAAMRATGVNSVALATINGIDVNGSAIFQNYTARPGNDLGLTVGYSETNAAIQNQIRSSRASGQSVIFRPLVDFLDPSVTGVATAPYYDGVWRAYYRPKDIQAFFDETNPKSYASFIISQAKLAQASGAQIFDIGTELDPLVTTKTLGYWTELIASVRAVFKGQLTYSAHWTDGGAGGAIGTIPVSFWRQLDYIGVDAYVSASNPADLVGAWTKVPTDPALFAAFKGKSAIDFLEGIAEAAGKPLLFTEIGYTNAANAATDPLNQYGTPSPETQAALYSAFFDAWTKAGPTALAGAYLFNWNPSSADGGITPTDFTPQGNPAALAAVKDGFSAPAPYVVTLTVAAKTIGSAIKDASAGPRSVIVTPYAAGGGSGAAVAGGTVSFTRTSAYSGGTLIFAGTVNLQAAKALGTGGLALLAGTVNLGGFDLSLPTLRGAGQLVATAGSPYGMTTLTVGSGTFSGALKDAGSASSLQLVKAGSGSLVLSGSSLFSTTRLDGGTLEIAGARSGGGSSIAFAKASKLVLGQAALQGSAIVAGKGLVFGSVLDGFGLGDRIELAGFNAITSVTASFARSVYSLILTGTGISGGVLTLQFSGVDAYASGLDTFRFGGNGRGGTIITVGEEPARIGVTVSAFIGDAATLGKVAGGVGIVDTAGQVTAGLSRLSASASRIKAILVTDKPVVVSAAGALLWRAALDKIEGGYSVSDTGNSIQARLDALGAAAESITQITLKSGTVSVSAASFEVHKAVLDKIVGGFALRDTSAALLDLKDALAADVSHIKSIAFTDAAAPTLFLTAAEARRDAALIAKITSPYVLKVSNPDGTTTTTGRGEGLSVVAAVNDTITGGSSADTFIVGPGLSQVTITDFYRSMTGSIHDTIILPKSEFADFGSVLREATFSSSGAIITAPAGGDQLILPKVTAAALARAEAAFEFV